MTHKLDVERLATMVRTKRAARGLREVSVEIGSVSPSTLSRVENARLPDMETFLLLCNWLDVAPAEFFRTNEAESDEKNTPADTISLQLRADRNLDPATANALATIIEAAYNQLSRNKDQSE